MAGPDPGPGLAPGLRPCRARHRPPRRALGSSPPLGRSASKRLRHKRLRRSGFAAFWTPPLRGPVCTGDARFSQRDRRRSARCLPLSIGSAVAVGLCPVSRCRPSNPPSFRRSPAPRRHPRAASGRPSSAGQPSAEQKLFGSGKNLKFVQSESHAEA